MMMMMMTMMCINVLTCLSLMLWLACLLAAFSQFLTSLAESTAHRDYLVRATIDYSANHKIIAEYIAAAKKCLKQQTI